MTEIREFATWDGGAQQVRKWVPLEEHEKLLKRLSGALQHLEEAREGLANYAQDLADLRQALSNALEEAEGLNARLADLKRTRQQERDYVDVCYENERLRKLTEWQPIKTAPEGVVALFCVVPLTAEDDHFLDTSGFPILGAPRPPRIVLSKLHCGWSSLEKAILWMPVQPLPQTCDESPK